MDIKTVRELAAVLREFNLNRVDVSDGGMRVILERGAPRHETALLPPESAAETEAPAAPSPAVVRSGAVKSTLVGTVYLKPAADADSFVSVGSRVEKGDTLCLVEAMKMYNDITADRSGTVVEICVANGQSVDYGQVLFYIEGD